MLAASPSLVDRLTALAFFGQSRWLEWQALIAHTALREWSQAGRDWGYGDSWQPWLAGGRGGNGLYGPAWEVAENFSDIAKTWGRWTVHGQLATAQGLLNYCALPYLDLPYLSGRRSTILDPGRRRSAIVINFPDRRRPEPLS